MQRTEESKTERISKDEYFYEMARTVSLRATCGRRSVGAVIVSDEGRILTTGYNGSPPTQPHCRDVGCEVVDNHCQRAIHAEVNAVAQAAIYGISIKGAKLYLYTGEERIPPCRECTKVLMAAGVDITPAIP